MCSPRVPQGSVESGKKVTNTSLKRRFWCSIAQNPALYAIIDGAHDHMGAAVKFWRLNRRVIDAVIGGEGPYSILVLRQDGSGVKITITPKDSAEKTESDVDSED